MKRPMLLLGAMALVLASMGAQRDATAANCTSCQQGPFGAKCESDSNSYSICQVTSKSKCKYRLAGKGNIDFGVTKLGTSGGLSGEGELTCEWEQKCDAIASCQPGCSGRVGSFFGGATCALAAAQAEALFRSNPPPSISSFHSYTWFSVDPVTAEYIAIAMGAQ